LVDSYGEEGETEVWLDMAFDSGYLPEEKHRYFRQGYDEVGKMLHSMICHPEKSCTSATSYSFRQPLTHSLSLLPTVDLALAESDGQVKEGRNYG